MKLLLELEKTLPVLSFKHFNYIHQALHVRLSTSLTPAKTNATRKVPSLFC